MDALIADAAIVTLGLACLWRPQIIWYWKWSWRHKSGEPTRFETALGRLAGAAFVALGLALAWSTVKLRLWQV